MGILKEFNDIIKDVRSSDIKEYFGKKRYSSIARQSTEGTAMCTELITRGLDIETSQMITKALERKYASFLQIVISMNPYLDLSKTEDVSAYLKQFHTNINTKFRPGEIFTDKILLENVNVLSSSDLAVMFAITEGSNANIINDNIEQQYSVLEDLCPVTVNHMYKPEEVRTNFKNKNLNAYYVSEAKGGSSNFDKATMLSKKEKIDVAHKQRDFHYKSRQDDFNNALKLEDVARNNERDTRDFNYRQSQDNLKQANTNRDYNLKKEQHGSNVAKNIRDLEYRQYDMMSKSGVKLTDNEVKKANELVPTTMSVTLSVRDGSSFGGMINFVLGVKVHMHPIDSQEMVRNIVNGCRRNNKFFDFVRWTSGEISFFKDLVLNLNEIKDDIGSRNGNSQWWSTLKRMKSLSAFKKATFSKNKIMPNASIVITMEEAEYIKSTYGFDLLDNKFVDKLMKEYFLFSFVVVDTSMEVAHFKFEGQEDFETVSFNGLERENNSKNDFKEMYKLINSGRL